MDRNTLLKEMSSCIGTQEPVRFFEKMVDVFTLLFNRIESLELELKETRRNSALAIQWEPQVARSMITAEINKLREDKETYFDEISDLKKAFVEDRVTQNYTDFCNFWQETLGFHPFLDYK
jgi:hypothetical protein